MEIKKDRKTKSNKKINAKKKLWKNGSKNEADKKRYISYEQWCSRMGALPSNSKWKKRITTLFKPQNNTGKK